MVTNIVLFVMPLVGLGMMMYLRESVLSNTSVFGNFKVSIPVPYIFNMPIGVFSNMDIMFNVTECQENYYYEFNETSAGIADQEFFGFNDGHS